MNPWKTEYRTDNNASTAHMTAMTDTGIKHGNIGIGVPAPSEKLDVDGKVKATEFIGRGVVLLLLFLLGGSCVMGLLAHPI